MSTINHALEVQVRAIRKLSNRNLARGTSASLHLDRHFSALTDLLSPRIAYLIRRYGLTDIADDAQQASAIAVHRAIQDFDVKKASFSTFVTWKLRGELQQLRHRVRLDQRPGAVRMGARTVSLETGGAGETPEAFAIADNDAQGRTEAGASATMARRMAASLLDEYSACRRLPARPDTITPAMLDAMEATLAQERQIVASHLLGVPNIRASADDRTSLTTEQKRQITRRVLRHVTKQVQSEPRYEAARMTVH